MQEADNKYCDNCKRMLHESAMGMMMVVLIMMTLMVVLILLYTVLLMLTADHVHGQEQH